MNTKALMAVACMTFAGTAPLVAHHSAAAEFDSTKVFELAGVVTEVVWENPHVFFYIDVTDEKTGEVVNWAMEMANINRLMRQGWTRDSMKIGDKVMVGGSPARNGSLLGIARGGVTLTETGELLFVGSNDN